jgi:hypothetical protein
MEDIERHGGLRESWRPYLNASEAGFGQDKSPEPGQLRRLSYFSVTRQVRDGRLRCDDARSGRIQTNGEN